MAEKWQITPNTVRDMCFRRLDLSSVSKFRHLLEKWMLGDPFPLSRILKQHVPESRHRKIDSVLAKEKVVAGVSRQITESSVKAARRLDENFNFSTDPETAKKLKVLAVMKGVTANDWLGDIMSDVIESEYKKWLGNQLEVPKPEEKKEVKMEDEAQLNNVRELYSKLHEITRPSQSVQKVSRSTKKPRDKERERRLREAIGKYLTQNLNWGKFKLRSEATLEFQNSSSTVLCKYSSYSPELHRWFWGVGYKYWSQWDDNCSLALLADSRDGASCSLLFLESKEAMCLFKKCSESGGEKKINLRTYKSDGLLHLQEWKEYDVAKNIKKLEFQN